MKIILTLIIFFYSLSLFAQIDINTPWTWMKGDNTINNSNVYGSINAPSGINKPSSRIGALSWKDPSGNLLLFGGQSLFNNIYGYQNDLWKYNITTNQWSWINGDSVRNVLGVYGTKGVASISNKPGARNYSLTWTDNNGNLWLFGGVGYATSGTYGDLNDLWKYDILSGFWTWVSGNNTIKSYGVYGSLGVSAAGNIPGARDGSMSWIDASGNIFLYGGYGYATSGTINLLSDLWKYDPLSNLWTWISGDNTTNAVAVHGVQGVAAAGNKPGSRYASSSWKDVAGNFWFFGGESFTGIASQPYGDLWKYDPLTSLWTWVKGNNTSRGYGNYGIKGTTTTANKPGAREDARSFIDAFGNFWLFGGLGYAVNNSPATNYQSNLNDLWKYEPAINQWTWIKGDSAIENPGVYGAQTVTAATNKPPGKAGCASWLDASGTFWHFGGYIVSGYTNDLWKLGTASGTLPVTLLNLTAQRQGNNATLVQWKTSTEINSNYFDVERSSDAINFQFIGKVYAAGNSSREISYSFTDNQPIKGVNYYRLKQVDLDGHLIYSPARFVRFDDVPGFVKYYPNPTNGILNIEITPQMQSEAMVINISNASGVMTDQIKRQSNSTNILMINMKRFGKGTYFIQVKTNSTNSTQRIVLQ